MKIALISDIHGNLEALTAVLDHIDKQAVDQIHCLGDVIGYGSDPVSCLELIDKACQSKIMGNHEYAALGMASTEHYNAAAQLAAEWTKNQLTDRQYDMMAAYEMEHASDGLFLVHASPYQPSQWHYVLTLDAAIEAFMHLKQNICFHGHSHLPQIFAEKTNGLPRSQVGHDFLPDPECRYLINVGSVGQPRDNDPRACYAIFDTVEHEVLYHRVEYDIGLTQGKMMNAHLPEMLISRLATGR